MTAAVDRAVGRLRAAAVTGTPCPPVRDLIGATDVTTAYAVQHRLTAERLASGAVVVGRKIGLTAPAVQRQLGVDQPDFGMLFDDMVVPDGSEVAVQPRLLQPRAEAEIAFVLCADLASGDLDDAQIRAAVAYATPAIEIVDSRIAGWDITFGDTVADNASSGMFVLGQARVTLDHFEPAAVVMSMRLNDAVVSTGTGAACLGDPLRALAWLALTARGFSEPLRAGQVVLSGALGPMVDVKPGDTVYADVTGLGEVSVAFT